MKPVCGMSVLRTSVYFLLKFWYINCSCRLHMRYLLGVKVGSWYTTPGFVYSLEAWLDWYILPGKVKCAHKIYIYFLIKPWLLTCFSTHLCVARLNCSFSYNTQLRSAFIRNYLSCFHGAIYASLNYFEVLSRGHIQMSFQAGKMVFGSMLSCQKSCTVIPIRREKKAVNKLPFFEVDSYI